MLGHLITRERRERERVSYVTTRERESAGAFNGGRDE